ncbi:5-formyltetrahydrofolate cyclo-ligase [Rhizobium sp. TRM95111]|uniref:5-formyltetrahydrofolate cyclo-ligase n=1 Tax=Rhizobium alarense TaxID=2846851 RepID=UPI001F378635|nr:5-formyltetrahydrofolate cyclo-ligase [Rhizobium alarense]MCF3643062.1 5-formyltetrahydrofolate cyclo-ligase [Rhizobium alarense]
MTRDAEERPELSSPACQLHEIDPAYAGLPPTTPGEVMAWRKASRDDLIARRMALAPESRQRWSERIAAAVAARIGPFEGLSVSFYWPFRGEPDLRPLASAIWHGGGRALLPVVVAKATPLRFKPWRDGDRLERGVWNIPVPATEETARPDVVIAPVVGFDPACYRLGYGGGFFDRTLAALSPSPALVIGVGYSLQSLPTIHPQSYDVPMSCIVTEHGLVATR